MHIPDECFDQLSEVVTAVTMKSFKRVRKFDKHPRPLKFSAQLSMAEDVLTILDWSGRHWLGHGVEEVTL